MSSFDELRTEALKKAELANGFSGNPCIIETRLISIERALKLFPPRPDREHVDPTQKFGQIAIAGRIMLRRDAGKKLMFLTVQDRSGQMQVAINASMVHPERMEFLRKTINSWDLMSFDGELSFSNAGEPTLWVSIAEFMGKSLRAAPDKVEGVSDKEILYRRRYLDLICNRESMQRFVERSKIIHTIRNYMHDAGFLEVDTPILETVTNGASARPFQTHLNALSIDMRLRIATEISLKKLIIGGMERVFEIGRIFRNEGIDRSHNPEFTSIEMYQAYGNLDRMIRLMEVIMIRCGLGDEKTEQFCRREYMDLIREHTGCDPWDSKALRRKLASYISGNDLRLRLESSMNDVEVLDAVFSYFVESKLQAPTFVMHQPLEQSPLCRAWPEDPRLADRFEFYCNGMEIANAYQELNDPVEQRKRLEAQGVVDEEFIEALEHGMPACAGMGIGIDRLVMLLTKAESIRDVILFPLMRPEAPAQKDWPLISGDRVHVVGPHPFGNN